MWLERSFAGKGRSLQKEVGEMGSLSELTELMGHCLLRRKRKQGIDKYRNGDGRFLPSSSVRGTVNAAGQPVKQASEF